MDQVKVANDVSKMLIKKHDDAKIIYKAKELLDKKRQIIPVSPCLDIGLGGGLLEGTWTIISGPPKCGKMQSLSSKVYTPTGYKTMGDIKVGDEVLSHNSTSKVLGTFDNGKQSVYIVEFENGDTVECGLPHLWEVQGRYRKNRTVKKTSDLINDLYETDGRPKWAIITPSCDFAKKETKMNPYLLGALIGDGGFSSKTIVFTNVDKELLNKVNSLLENEYKLHQIDNSISYRITNHKQSNKYIGILKEYGLMGLTSHDKFIPEEFIYNSREIRLEIIRGLFDTDGCSNKRGSVEYSTVSIRLANDVKNIIQSLGGITKIRPRITKCNGKKFLSYRLNIRYNNPSELFSLSRKKDRCKIRTKKPLTRKIVSITYKGEEECKCISVDNDRGLYVTDNFIVTHNTMSALQIASNAQKLGRYVYYMAVESRIQPRDLEGINGFDVNMCSIIQSQKGKILTAEDYLNDGMSVLKEHPGCVLIIDSSSALCSTGEFSKDITASGRADGPKLLASFCRQMAPIVQTNDCLVIIIQHLIANTSGYGPAYMEDGGRKILYQFDTKIRCKGVQKWLEGEKKQIGNILTWEIVGSPIGPPGGSVESYVKFGYGIDSEMELAVVGTDLGLISKAGAWYTLEFLLDDLEWLKKNTKIEVEESDDEDLSLAKTLEAYRKAVKFQGQEKMKNFLVENPAVKEKLFLKIKEMS